MHYQPGKEMHLANYLFRASHKLNQDNEIPGEKLTINEISIGTNANLVSLLQVQDTTKNDETLQQLIKFILVGGPLLGVTPL